MTKSWKKDRPNDGPEDCHLTGSQKLKLYSVTYTSGSVSPLPKLFIWVLIIVYWLNNGTNQESGSVLGLPSEDMERWQAD
jgi:hypothetical protein